MKLDYGSQKPMIHVYYCRQIRNASSFQELLSGMEEEGVPCLVAEREESAALELAYKAAESSNLSVGVGIGADETVVLHYIKLKPEEPLFSVSLQSGKTSLRMLGANAARLVKGVPFKSLTDMEEAESGENEEISQSEIEYMTAVIVKRISDLLRDKGGAGFA